jgi:hypothetical protein
VAITEFQQQRTPEVLFAFPLSAATEAVTAVMTVNGKVFMEPLHPFKDPVN